MLVSQVEETEKQVGGLFVPSSAQNSGTLRANVVAVGNKDIPEDIVVGAIVLVPYLASPIVMDGKKVYIMSVEDIIGVVSE